MNLDYLLYIFDIIIFMTPIFPILWIVIFVNCEKQLSLNAVNLNWSIISIISIISRVSVLVTEDRVHDRGHDLGQKVSYQRSYIF